MLLTFKVKDLHFTKTSKKCSSKVILPTLASALIKEKPNLIVNPKTKRNKNLLKMIKKVNKIIHLQLPTMENVPNWLSDKSRKRFSKGSLMLSESEAIFFKFLLFSLIKITGLFLLPSLMILLSSKKMAGQLSTSPMLSTTGKWKSPTSSEDRNGSLIPANIFTFIKYWVLQYLNFCIFLWFKTSKARNLPREIQHHRWWH